MQVLINGLISGLEIALLALAFAVVYYPARAFHVALGGIYVAAPFVAWACLQAGCSWFVAVSSAVFAGIGLSMACELINHRPLERKGASPGAHLISSLGIYIVFVQIVALVSGNESKVLRTGLDHTLIFGPTVLTYAQITAAAAAFATILGFFLWLRFADLGLQFRALADNPVEYALRGYNVNRSRLFVFALSGGLCSVAAILAAYDTGFDPHGGLSALLLAMVAAIIGGRHSFLGAILGGVLLGLARAEVVWFLSAKWQDAATFLLLALFLFLRPNGLLGRKARLEAQP